MIKILGIILLLNLVSCSGFMNSLYRDLDKGDRKTSKRRKGRRGSYDKFDQFRNGSKYRRKRPTSSSQVRNFLPKTKRKYRPASQVKKRYTADDLNDNGNSESLWAGENKNDYLFTLNEKKQSGDIILVNVFTKLKNEITLELKKTFKERKRPRPKKDDKAAAGATAATPTPAPPAAPAEEDKAVGGPDKVHDRISTVIIEEISKDHILLRGQKFLIYKNKKRLVELQALVARRDITDDDAVNSPKILESNITVLR